MSDRNKQQAYSILEVRDYYPSTNNPSSSTWVFGQVLSLKNMGYNPLVISPTPIIPFKSFFPKRFKLYDTPDYSIQNYKGTDVIRPGYIKLPENKTVGFNLKNLSNCLLKYGDYKSIKLIHAHFGQNGVAALALKQKLNVPLITSFYGFDAGGARKQFQPHYKKLIEKGDLFLALSQDMKNDLVNLEFPENKIVVHHLGVDLASFTPTTERNKKFTLLTIARLVEVKGIQFVIKAFADFLTKHPSEKEKIEYKIIGGGEYEPVLKQLVSELKLEQNVIFINNLILNNAREIVNIEMQTCDLFALTSFTTSSGHKEGTPVVLMEAQACDKACISSWHAGIPEIVINNQTGILVPEKAVPEIENAIEKLYFNNELREQMGTNARAHIMQEFNHTVQMQKLDSIFKQLI